MIDPNKVVEQIIRRGTDWYDYTKLDKQAWRNYYNDAQIITKSDVFNNELRHYITDLIKFITYEAQSFDQVLHTRTGIIALETFAQRLQSIQDPVTKVDVTQPFNPI